ncbi:MAG: hypothetical protein HC876_04790 [Chloroflexaceae bacterium]|nr:hypothetical protein [Chloroflexaceae bacterium]
MITLLLPSAGVLAIPLGFTITATLEALALGMALLIKLQRAEKRLEIDAPEPLTKQDE